MKKTTVARVLATAASTAGALVCPQLVANPYADTAIKAGVATLLSCIPDGVSTVWQKSKEYDIKVEVQKQPIVTEEVPSATVTTTDIKANMQDGVSVEQHKGPAPTADAKNKPNK